MTAIQNSKIQSVVDFYSQYFNFETGEILIKENYKKALMEIVSWERRVIEKVLVKNSEKLQQPIKQNQMKHYRFSSSKKDLLFQEKQFFTEEQVRQVNLDKFIGEYEINNQINIKCIVVGDGGVGKTHLCHVAMDNRWPEYISGHDFSHKMIRQIQKSDNETVCTTVELFDTAGQDDYDRLRPLGYLNSHIFILCFSVTLIESFERVMSKWITEIRDHMGFSIPVVLMGTRSDLRLFAACREDFKGFIDYNTGEELARLVGATSYLETSSARVRGFKDLDLFLMQCIAIDSVRKNKKCVLM